MSWPLSRLRVLFASVLFVSVLLPTAEQRRQPEQWRWVWWQRKAEMVASRFGFGVHACRGADAHAVPRKHREANVPA
jgi:hypothetical protein